MCTGKSNIILKFHLSERTTLTNPFKGHFPLSFVALIICASIYHQQTSCPERQMQNVPHNHPCSRPPGFSHGFGMESQHPGVPRPLIFLVLAPASPTSFMVLSSGSGDCSLSCPCDLLLHSVSLFLMLSLLVAVEEPACGQIPIFLGRCAFYCRFCCPLPRPLHPIMRLRLWPFLSPDAVFSTLTCLSTKSLVDST